MVMAQPTIARAGPAMRIQGQGSRHHGLTASVLFMLHAYLSFEHHDIGIVCSGSTGYVEAGAFDYLHLTPLFRLAFRREFNVVQPRLALLRSEERRVGKECGSRRGGQSEGQKC